MAWKKILVFLKRHGDDDDYRKRSIDEINSTISELEVSMEKKCDSYFEEIEPETIKVKNCNSSNDDCCK